MNYRVYGVLGIETINSNFNANFENEPKNIEGGQLYASDVSIKYATKVLANADGEIVLGLKKFGEDGYIDTLAKAYEKNFDTTLKANTPKEEILENLSSAFDIKQFGITFAVKDRPATNLYGNVQINNALNVLKNTTMFSDTILSPYASDNDKKSTTLGEDVRVDKAHYLYNYEINPSQNKEYHHIPNVKYTEKDYEKFKEYALTGVTRLHSRTKLGSENNLAIFVEIENNKKNNQNMTPNLISLIDIVEDDNILDVVTYSLRKLSGFLSDIQTIVRNIEIYVKPQSIKLEDVPNNTKVFDINTKKELFI